MAFSSVFEHDPFSTIVHVQALSRLLSRSTEKAMDCKDKKKAGFEGHRKEGTKGDAV